MNIEYSYFLNGRNPFMRECIELLDQTFEVEYKNKVIEENSSYFKSLPQMKIDTASRMDASIAIDMAIGVCTFLAGYIGTKVLDEIYNELVRPGLVDLIKKIKTNEKFTYCKVIDFFHVCHIKDINTSIVVRLTTTKDCDENTATNLMNSALNAGENYISNFGSKAPIHYYHIMDGHFNSIPHFRNSLKEIQTEGIQFNKNLVWDANAPHK